MKHLYPLIGGIILFIAISAPREVRAQCSNCPVPGGGTVTHFFRLDTTTAAESWLTFPKFDPSIGTLTCIALHDTLSIAYVAYLWNGSDQTVFPRFTIAVNNTVLGPPSYSTEEFRYNDYSHTFPPRQLDPQGTGDDSTTLGPDTPFNKSPSASSISPTASYIGSGNVNLKFTVGGGVTSNIGLTYIEDVRTKVWGTFRLTYYYCPAASMPVNITHFNAYRKGNTIQVSWDVNNEEKSNTYEIEVSTDGRNFSSIGKVANQYASSGAAAKYHHQFVPQPAAAAQYYIRIKQILADGTIRYSTIRVVNGQTGGPASLILYPNPASDKVTLQFDQLMNGQFDIDLVNTAGQVVYRRTFRASNTNLIPVPFSQKPSPGIYYLRAKDQATGQVYTNKLLIGQKGTQ